MPPRRGTSAALSAGTSAAVTLWGVPSHLLRVTAGQAPRHCDRRAGRGDQGLERDRHRGPGPASLDKAGELHPLALVLAATRARGMAAPAGPDGGLGEVVEPCAPATACGVERFLLVARIAGGEVGDRASRAVPETHGGLHI